MVLMKRKRRLLRGSRIGFERLNTKFDGDLCLLGKLVHPESILGTGVEFGKELTLHTTVHIF
jgi:hypothetical protein